MDKIYRRKTQLKNTPKKKKDEKARKRNTIVNFRTTPLEKRLIDARIETLGMAKTDFFVQSCLYQTILVHGNISFYSSVEKKIKEIANKINKDTNIENLDPELQESLLTILQLLEKY